MNDHPINTVICSGVCFPLDTVISFLFFTDHSMCTCYGQISVWASAGGLQLMCLTDPLPPPPSYWISMIIELSYLGQSYWDDYCHEKSKTIHSNAILSMIRLNRSVKCATPLRLSSMVSQRNHTYSSVEHSSNFHLNKRLCQTNVLIRRMTMRSWVSTLLCDECAQTYLDNFALP